MKKLKFKMIFLPISMIVLSGYYSISAFKNINSSQILLHVLALAVIIIAILPNIRQRIYRDKLNFSVMGLGIIINLFIAAGLYSDSGDYSVFLQRLGFSIGGILLGGGSFYVMGLVGDFLFKKESVGGGDVKLIAGVGSLIGPSAAWLAPLWIPAAILFFVIYKTISAMVKKYADSSVPSAPMHFTSLICLLFIQLGLINPIVVGLILIFNIYSAYVIASPSSQSDDCDEKSKKDTIDVAVIAEKTCDKCKKSNDAEAKFCGFCGENLSSIADSTYKQEINQKAKEPLLALICTFILPGLGQIYSKRIKRGLFILGFNIIVGLLTLQFILHPTFKMTVPIMIMLAIFNLYVLFDAYACSKAFNKRNHIERKISGIKRTFLIIGILISFSAFPIVRYVRINIVDAIHVNGNSMQMVLKDNDSVFVDKLIYKYHEPKMGNVILFRFPEDASRIFISRIIAEGGETVEIKNGDIYINGQLTKDSIVGERFYYNKGEYGTGAVDVPNDHYFVLGDNSKTSNDSRLWGFVPKKNIIGKVFKIFWPINRIGAVK